MIVNRLLGRGGIESRSSLSITDAIRARKAGIPVGVDAATRHTAVFACVRLISESIASMPAHAHRSVGDARLLVDPQPGWLTEPNHDQTAFEFRRDLLTSLLLRGNAYVWVVEVDSRGWPLRLATIHPDRVSVRADGGMFRWEVDGQSVSLVADGGPLLHIPGIRFGDSPLGVSPIEAASRAIATGLEAERFGLDWFGSGAPFSVLRSERELSDDSARRLQARWVAARESGGQFPAVLSGGVSWEPVSLRPSDAQFLETQRFSVAQIARVFGVPPHMIGDVERSTSWGSGIEAQSIGFLRHTLQPWITLVDQRLTMLVPRGQFVRTNPAGLLRADVATRYLAYQRALFARFMTKNEIRALEDLPPIEGGDDINAPLGTMKVEG